MTPNTSQPSSDSNSDTPNNLYEAELARLVGELADRLQAGEALSLSEICAAQPEFRDDLRLLWGTLVVTDAAAATARGPAAELPDRQTLAASPDADSLLAGTLPIEIGDYRLLEVIGRGGMGVVYRAQQISLSRVVAVKMILESRRLGADHRQRFFAEAEATARLEHPSIVSIFEVSEFQGHPFFSMQFVQGETLSDRLKQGPLPQRTAARIMVDACRAIDYAHRKGALHRDLKPSTIMLDREG